MQQKMVKLGLLMAAGAIGLLGCADSAPHFEEKPDELAETIYNDVTLLPVDKVDWKAAASPAAGLDPRGDFMRAQHLMAQLAAASYEDQAGFDAIARPLGFTGVRVKGETGIFGATKPDAYVGFGSALRMSFIAIRGTEDGNDWLTDLFNAPTLPTRYGNAPITLHQGFAQYADEIYKQVKTQLHFSCGESLKPAERVPLWVTGHSLGAAAASIIAYRLAEEGCNVAGVSLFGSPRPGLSDFQSAYNAPTLLSGSLQSITQRWVNGQDPIYCMPPGGAWKHVGNEYRIAGDITLSAEPTNSQCTSLAGWVGFVQGLLDPASIPLAGLPLNMEQALLDWLAGLIKLSLVCQAGTHWDDLWSLGGCSVVDETHRLASVYNISPQDLLSTALRLAVVKHHRVHRYVNAIGADFSDPPVQMAKLRVRMESIGGSFNASAPTYQVVERVRGGDCQADVDLEQGVYWCDFEVPVGSTAVLRVYKPQMWSPNGECEWVQEPGATYPDCHVRVDGDQTLELIHGIVF